MIGISAFSEYVPIKYEEGKEYGRDPEGRIWTVASKTERKNLSLFVPVIEFKNEEEAIKWLENEPSDIPTSIEELKTRLNHVSEKINEYIEDHKIPPKSEYIHDLLLRSKIFRSEYDAVVFDVNNADNPIDLAVKVESEKDVYRSRFDMTYYVKIGEGLFFQFTNDPYMESNVTESEGKKSMI